MTTPNGPSSPTDGRVGEVVRASTTEFETGCYELYQSPPLGALVVCGEETPIFGVVADSLTESMDPTRPPAPRGAGMASEREVYDDNPQLSRLLSTRFTSLAVGHMSGSDIRWRLAPNPARILSFVRICDDDETRDFSAEVGFLPRLLDARVGSPDEFVAAYLRRCAAVHSDPESFVIRAGKEIAGMLPGQLRRVSAILRTATS